MSTDENKALVERFVEEFWNEGNLKTADELMATDAEIHLPAGEVVESGRFAHVRDVTKGGRLLWVTLVRWVATTLASTAIAATSVVTPTCSSSNAADQASVSSGWISWTWPIFATPPRARPAYQAKKPSSALTIET